MMSTTHAVIAVSVASFAMGTVDPLVLGAATVGSQLPDVDTSKSLAGRVLFPLSMLLEHHFPHRTVTHSFLATATLALVALPLWFYDALVWKALMIGFFMGWFADTFTRSGVAAFYPATPARMVVPANPRLRLKTGSRAEFVVILLFLGLGAVSFNLHSAGGLMRVFNSMLGQPSGAADLFRKEGHARQILAQIEGHGSAGAVSGEFEIVDVLAGDALLVRDSSGVLHTAGDRQFCASCEIAAQSVKARTGAGIRTQAIELRLNEQDVAHVLRRVNLPPNARVYISGELTFEDGSIINLPRSLQRFNPLIVSGEEVKTVRLHYASVEDLQRLAGYEASGQLLIKVVETL